MTKADTARLVLEVAMEAGKIFLKAIQNRNVSVAEAKAHAMTEVSILMDRALSARAEEEADDRRAVDEKMEE